MKNNLRLCGVFALWVLGSASCGQNSESPRIQTASNSRTNGGISNEVIAGSVEKETEDQMNGAHEYLEVIVQNGTGGNIDETEVAFGKRSCTFGVVGKGVSAGYSGWRYSVGSNAVVRWRDSNGIKKESKVEISNVYDPNLAGHLTFTIAGTNAVAKFLKVDRK